MLRRLTGPALVGAAVLALAACVTAPPPERLVTSDDMAAALKLKAARWDAESMRCLGELYVQGVGVQKDLAKGVELLDRARSGGDKLAQLIWALNVVTIQDDAHAYDLSRYTISKLVEEGEPHAQLYMGTLSLYGSAYLSTDVDFAKARSWFEQAAAQDSPEAEAMLASLYHHGWGVPVDEAKARELRAKAAAHSLVCPVEFATLIEMLLESALDYPPGVAAGSESGTTGLRYVFRLGKAGEPTLYGSSGFAELDHAVFAAAGRTPLPVWSGPGAAEFKLRVEFTQGEADPASNQVGLNYRRDVWNATLASLSRLWQAHPYHTRNQAVAWISFDCLQGKTANVAIKSAGTDDVVGNLAAQAVTATTCPAPPPKVKVSTHFDIGYRDVWDDPAFDDPQDQPATPYGVAVRAAIRKGLVMPQHALVFGTRGTGVAAVAFDVRGGKVLKATLAESSGDAEVDKTAVQEVRSAVLPAPPPEQAGELMHMTMHVNYQLETLPPPPPKQSDEGEVVAFNG